MNVQPSNIPYQTVSKYTASQSIALRKRYVETVCARFDVTPQMLAGNGRTMVLSRARFCLIYCLHRYLGLSVTEIAALIDKDRTAIMHGLKRAIEMRLGDGMEITR